MSQPLLIHEHSTYVRKSLGKLFLRWTFVCVFSAAPSFFFGAITAGQYQWLAMLNGIAVFISVYAMVDYKTQHMDWRQKSIVKNTLVFGYASRMIVSVLYPLSTYMDMCCGAASLSFVQTLMPSLKNALSGTHNTWHYFPVLLTTLVQGCLLNLILFVYMLLAFGIQLVFRPLFSRS